MLEDLFKSEPPPWEVRASFFLALKQPPGVEKVAADMSPNRLAALVGAGMGGSAALGTWMKFRKGKRGLSKADIEESAAKHVSELQGKKHQPDPIASWASQHPGIAALLMGLGGAAVGFGGAKASLSKFQPKLAAVDVARMERQRRYPYGSMYKVAQVTGLSIEKVAELNKEAFWGALSLTTKGMLRAAGKGLDAAKAPGWIMRTRLARAATKGGGSGSKAAGILEGHAAREGKAISGLKTKVERGKATQRDLEAEIRGQPLDAQLMQRHEGISQKLKPLEKQLAQAEKRRAKLPVPLKAKTPSSSTATPQPPPPKPAEPSAGGTPEAPGTPWWEKTKGWMKAHPGWTGAGAGAVGIGAGGLLFGGGSSQPQMQTYAAAGLGKIAALPRASSLGQVRRLLGQTKARAPHLRVPSVAIPKVPKATPGRATKPPSTGLKR